ncbi:MAG: sugar ABC transporter permease [Candidatus Hydrogenedentes bacterium]|nr:sugar ABC transporter permease [Candidatus Hydrogenedentota bacterium]
MVTRRRAMLAALLFLLPNLLGFAIFTLIPVGFSLLASFTNWNISQAVPLRWVGLDNYIALLRSEPFWLYLVNTGYLMLGLPVAIGGSLFLATLLSRPIRGGGLYRTLFYLPSFTAGIALYILWKKLFNPTVGPINYALDTLLMPLHTGGEAVFTWWLWSYVPQQEWMGALLDPPWWLAWTLVQSPSWLGSTQNLFALHPEHVQLNASQFGFGARDAIIVMGVWGAIGGGNMLLYIAGIANIPRQLYEAAEIDGAGAWAKFRHITWPQLAPTTFFILVMSVIGGLQGGFEQARTLTEGGPAGTTTTLTYHIYNLAFEEFKIGYASAVSWVLFSMIFVVTLINWRFGNSHVNE